MENVVKGDLFKWLFQTTCDKMLMLFLALAASHMPPI